MGEKGNLHMSAVMVVHMCFVPVLYKVLLCVVFVGKMLLDLNQVSNTNKKDIMVHVKCKWSLTGCN